MRAVLLAMAAAGMACAAAPQARLTPEQVKLLRDRPWLGVTKKTLEIELLVYGPWHRQVEMTASRLGNFHQSAGAWKEEASCLRVVVEARRRLQGRVAPLQAGVGARQGSPGGRHPTYGNTLASLAHLHWKMGRHKDALPLYEKARFN